MKDYLLLFRGGLDFSTASPGQMQEAMMKWKTWIEGLKKDGKYDGGNRLANNGTTIKGTKKQVSDGPFTESKEIVGGYISIKAADKEAAIEIAKDCPIFYYDGIVEVREVAKM
jgi:hypothetical protein